jgi:hypothetical protein
VGAAARERGPGWRPLASALGARARPRMMPGAAPGVAMRARPWPCGGPRFTPHDVRFDGAHGTGTWPGGQTVPMHPGRAAQVRARAGDAWPQRAPCPTAPRGPGRTLTIRADAPCQPKRRAPLQPKRGRASLRHRPAVDHALAPPVATTGGEPALRGCASIHVTAGALRQSATSRSQPLMRSNGSSLHEL